jgi:hypothetical protein
LGEDELEEGSSVAGSKVSREDLQVQGCYDFGDFVWVTEGLFRKE